MNVLSIDFDWIMEPTIEAYNSLSHGRDAFGPAEIWRIIQGKIPGFSPECDLNKFTDLFFFLKEKVNGIDKDNIKIAFNHEEIYDFLDKDFDVSLYNIDHHHDMGYPQNDSEENKERALEGLGCGNWVSFLNKNKKIKQYTWIGNHNSNPPMNIISNDYDNFIFTTDLNALCSVKFDKIFICASWEWVPLKYRNLFDILISLLD